MILLAALAVGLLSVVLTGGRLSRLADVPFRHTWLLGIALAIQVPITTVMATTLTPSTAEGLHLGSYAFAMAWVVANRRLPGLLLTASGGAMNLAPIAANGGVMPASPAALATAGIPADTAGFVNSGAVEGARLAWLGDVFAIPEGWPLSNVFSVGDVVLIVGATWMMHRFSGTRLWRRDAHPATDAARPAEASSVAA